MKNGIYKKYISISSIFISIFLIAFGDASGQVNPGWAHVKYAIYFTSGDVEKLLSILMIFKKQWSMAR